MILLAADPGLTGALALLDTVTRDLVVADMPTTKNARKSSALKIIDAHALFDLIVMFREAYGATHFIVEQVGGIPKQSAPAAFNFGFGAGLLRMAAVGSKFTIEEVPPQRWKANMRVSTTPDQIRSRATEVFPFHDHLWNRDTLRLKSPNSEVGLGRAEAALLAAYGQRLFGAQP